MTKEQMLERIGVAVGKGNVQATREIAVEYAKRFAREELEKLLGYGHQISFIQEGQDVPVIGLAGFDSIIDQAIADLAP